jgi:phage protein D
MALMNGTFLRARAFCEVEVAGQPVTRAFNNHLIAVTVTDFESSMDTCQIDLDDSYGLLEVPPDGSKILIRLGWQGGQALQVFEGQIVDVSSTCQRRSGRLMRIEGTGANVLGFGKVPISDQWGEGEPPKGQAKKVKLSTVMEEAAKKAGYSFKAAESLGNIERDYWNQTNESFHNFADRIAKEVGGVVKIQGDKVSMTSNVDNKNAEGVALADVVCRWGANLMAWNIHPKVARPMFAETAKLWFDGKKGVWDIVKKAVGNTGASGMTKAIHYGLFPIATKDQAEQQAQADANSSLRAAGQGWVVIDGHPEAKAGATAIVQGARAGVDGTYRIIEAEHSYNRKGGFQTRLTLNSPGASPGGKVSDKF